MATKPTEGQHPKRTVLTINIDQLDLTDTQFQVRTSLNEDKVKEYEQILRYSGSRDLSAFHTRPLVWERPDGRYVVLDGWHRLHAAKTVGITRFEVEVLDADHTEATVQAMKANLSHGLPLKPQERVEACFRTFQVLTKNGVQPSNEIVAGQLGVCEGTIRNYRGQLETDGRLKAAVNVFGKNGKIQAAKKATPKKPVVRLKTAMPMSEGLAALKRLPLFGKSGSTSALPSLDRTCHEDEKRSCDPAPTAVPIKSSADPDDQDILKRATEILRGLDAKAWQACSEREELASLIGELMEAGIATLEAKDAAVATGEAA